MNGEVNHLNNNIPANCKNCGSKILGKFCFNCGQSTSDHHRSIFHLIYESIEGLFHLDGRLWRTLPAIFFRPGNLSKDYMEGRMARHVPPFRMFLIALLALILTSESKIHHATRPAHSATTNAHQSTAPSENSKTKVQFNAGDQAFGVESDINIFEMNETDRAKLSEGVNTNIPWMDSAIKNIIERPDSFVLNFFSKAHRYAILLLPIIAIILSVLYFYRRKYFVYDHFLVSMNLSSFIFFTIALALVLPANYGGWFYGSLFILTPINIFFHLRGAYGSSKIGAGFKSIILSISTFMSFTALIVFIMAIAASST